MRRRVLTAARTASRDEVTASFGLRKQQLSPDFPPQTRPILHCPVLTSPHAIPMATPHCSPILKRRKLRLREVKSPARSHTDNAQETRGFNPCTHPIPAF